MPLKFPPRERFTQCGTGMVWSVGRLARERPPRAHPYPKALIPTICGASITRASSSSAINVIVIRSPSPTTPRGYCCCAKRSSPRGKSWRFPLSNVSSGSGGSPWRFVPTTAFRSLPLTDCFSFRASRSGGCVSASPSNAFGPATPSRNGRHERMHLTLKQHATRPAAANFLQQQAKFDAFLDEFNNERPHQALDMKCPREVYTPSPRSYQGLAEPHYPFHDRTILVTSCGRICLHRKKINLSKSLPGQAVGIREVENGIWLVSFMSYDLGYIDLEERTLQPLENPFGPHALANPSVRPQSHSMGAPGETEASNAGEQLAKG